MQQLVLHLILAAAALPMCLACGRPSPPPAAAAGASPGASAAVAPLAAASAAGAATTPQSSEFIARNKPRPDCPDCKGPDAQNSPVYHGKPDMQLDDQTLADVRKTVDDTCAILEDGVAILEKHAQRPEAATAALDAYTKKSAQQIAKVFERAREVKARLRGAGYDQDIPAEIRPVFDERMGKIQVRLEKMRDTYRKHPQVLEAFGALFPRGTP